MIDKINKKKTCQSKNTFLNARKLIYKCLKPIAVSLFALTLLSETLVAGFNCLFDGTAASGKTLMTDLNLTTSIRTTSETLVTDLNLSPSFTEQSNENLNVEEDEEIDIEEIQKEVIETSSNPEEVDVDSRIALIYDRASGKILYEKNGNKQTPMASTTKIMTAIVVLENANLKDVVTIDAKAAGIGGSRLGLKKNDKITVNDLLYGLMLRSGNDAAEALANYVGGSIEGFAEMMNEKAKEIGLTNSHFIVPHGLDNDGHYTTAYELAKMADYALKIDKFKQIVGTQNTTIYINGYAKTINNTNKLLGSVSGVYGVKTGFTNGAGRCLVTACKRDDLDIVTVIIGADTTKQRTADTIKLINYAYNNFEVINIKDIVEEKFEQWRAINQSRIYVNKGVKNNVELLLEDMPFENMAIKKSDKDKIDVEVNSIFYLEAPVAKNQVLANMKITINGEALETLEVYSKEEIRKKEMQDYFIEFLEVINLVFGDGGKKQDLF